MDKSNLLQRVPAFLTGFCLLLGAPQDMNAAGNEPPAADAAGNFQGHLERGDLVVNVAASCTSDSRLPAHQATKLQLELERDLKLLLSDRREASQRKLLARYLAARMLLDQARAGADAFPRILRDVSADKPELIVSSLADLRLRLLLTAQMRDSRATLADMKIVNGKQELSLRPVVDTSDTVPLVAATVAQRLAQARRDGLDCSSAALYDFFLPKLPPTPTYGSIKHQDILSLYDQVTTLEEHFSRRVSQPGGSGATDPRLKEVGAAANATQELFGRAQKVLANAVEMQQAALNRSLGRPVLLLPPAPPAKTSPVPAPQAQTPPAQPVPAPQAQTPPAQPVPAPQAQAAQPQPSPAPQPQTPPAQPAPAQNGTSVPSPSAGTAVAKNVPIAELETRRNAIIQQVTRQTDALRSQINGHGRANMAPIGVANNLLGRLKRVYQVADMLVAERRADERYECVMSDDQVHITYTLEKGDLRKLQIQVDEKYQGLTLVSWFIHMDRTNDSNYSIQAEFNGIKSAMEVQNAELGRYPNHHQLMALMNRLGELLDRKS